MVVIVIYSAQPAALAAGWGGAAAGHVVLLTSAGPELQHAIITVHQKKNDITRDDPPTVQSVAAFSLLRPLPAALPASGAGLGLLRRFLRCPRRPRRRCRP